MGLPGTGTWDGVCGNPLAQDQPASPRADSLPPRAGIYAVIATAPHAQMQFGARLSRRLPTLAVARVPAHAIRISADQAGCSFDSQCSDELPLEDRLHPDAFPRWRTSFRNVLIDHEQMCGFPCSDNGCGLIRSGCQARITASQKSLNGCRDDWHNPSIQSWRDLHKSRI